MNTKYLFTAIVAMAPTVALAAEGAPALEEGLAAYADGVYEGVKVTEDGDALTVHFPETNIVEFKTNDKGAVETIPGTIPGYDAIAVKTGDLNGKDVFKITTSSPDKLRSEIYKNFALNGAEVESYSSEMHFVPDLNLMKVQNFDAKNIIFNHVDSQTGLKQEVSGVSDIQFRSELMPSNDEAQYSVVWKANNIRLKSQFISFVVPSLENKLSSTYVINEDTDYNKLITDASAIKQSSSVVSANNIVVETMGVKLTNNIVATGKAKLDEATQTMRIAGETEISDIKLEGVPDFSLQHLKLKYLLKNIETKHIAKLQELQSKVEKMDEEDWSNPTNEQIAERERLMKNITAVVNEITKKMELKFQADLNFAQSDVNMLAALKKSGKFLVGNGEVTVYNLDLLVPDYSKQCEEEQKLNPSSYPPSCMKSSFSSAIFEYIDKSKRTTDASGRTIDKVEIVFSETGIFVNGQNVGDPIEFDLNEMIANNITSSQSVSEPKQIPESNKSDWDSDSEEFSAPHLIKED